jgi:hypothetical protein
MRVSILYTDGRRETLMKPSKKAAEETVKKALQLPTVKTAIIVGVK